MMIENQNWDLPLLPQNSLPIKKKKEQQQKKVFSDLIFFKHKTTTTATTTSTKTMAVCLMSEWFGPQYQS